MTHRAEKFQQLKPESPLEPKVTQAALPVVCRRGMHSSLECLPGAFSFWPGELRSHSR